VFALLIGVFVRASLFGHWLPVPVQSTLFFIVLLLEVALIVAGWWLWAKSRNVEDIARWRKRVGLAGIVANTTALLIPVVSLLYMICYPFIRVGVRLPMIDGEWMILICLIFSLCGLIGGILAPPRSRFATALGGLIISLMILSIPIGIL
jgi:uncharacterized iron-regulated membrane protein